MPRIMQPFGLNKNPCCIYSRATARDFMNLDCHGQTPAHLQVRSSALAMTGWANVMT